jgi:hypothetical protein
LQREGLVRWLEADPAPCRLVASPDALEGAPALVLWSLAAPPEPATLLAEVQHLQERWQPAPLLLLLPRGHRYPTSFLLQLPVQGLLEEPEASPLRDAVAVLLEGGRVIEIAAAMAGDRSAEGRPALGLGQWLLISGLQQIDAELALCLRLLDPPPAQLLPLLLLQGRERELRAARQLLLWLWGPVNLAWSLPLSSPASTGPLPSQGTGALAAFPPHRRRGDAPIAEPASAAVAITLRQRTADGIWEALRERLREAAATGVSNRSGQLLALDGLNPTRRSDLLLALLEQFEQLRRRLATTELRSDHLPDLWRDRQLELRQESLRRMAGSYVQLPWEGGLRPVADTLVRTTVLSGEDPELPDPGAMLGTLIQARPMLVEGRLVAPDEPTAVLYLEMLLSNWLVRTAELISSEVLAACADWPELRRYLLRPELLATRNLERLRNQLNAQQRWTNWVERPIQLFESRRPLYRLEAGAIRSVDLTEPRDRELAQLGWLQQVVTLALEARDALAPQLQRLIQNLGNLVVVVLTQVVGRAIGLVGRGIVQGMGRSLGRS